MDSANPFIGPFIHQNDTNATEMRNELRHELKAFLKAIKSTSEETPCPQKNNNTTYLEGPHPNSTAQTCASAIQAPGKHKWKSEGHERQNGGFTKT